MLLDIFSTVINAIGEVASSLGITLIAIIGLGLTLLLVMISFIVTQFSIELKTARAVAKINRYLELNPFINEDNLVEFNKLMKKIPAPMRLEWQQYMVNRDKKPSEFFTENNCIEKPFKSSAYASQLVAVKVGIICISAILFVFNMAYYTFLNEQSILLGILSSTILSVAVLIIGALYMFFLKARRNASLSDLYFNFVGFQKYLDRACSTLPEYVDYEILFTRKEITSGIPVLQEYLQQRALFEQEQIKKAQESQVVHEQYDFSALGINGSLVMESSMRESEYVIGNKNRIHSEISELQTAMDMLNKSYDEKIKVSQRKLRDIQDSLDRLKEKLDNTTNLIVGNDLRKQRENEIQKQRQLEKEADEDNKKYEADKKLLEEQIAAKRAEIDTFKAEAEKRINGEFKTYADKIYKELRKIVEGQVKEEVENLTAEKVKLEQELEEKDRLYVEKNTVYEEKANLCEEQGKHIAELEAVIEEAQKIKAEFDQYSDEKNQEIFDAKKEAESRNIELEKKNQIIADQKELIKELKHKKQVIVNRYFNTDGSEIFFEDNGNAYVFDQMGQKEYISFDQNVDIDNNENYNFDRLLDENQEVVEPVESAEQVVEPKQEINKEESYANQTAVEQSDLGFTDDDILTALGENPEEVKKQREEAERQKSLEELKEQFHKPAYDFQWENSNANSIKAEEEQIDDATKGKKSKQAKEAEEIKDVDNVDEIDRLIEEQKTQLEKQNQDLAMQLEKTKKVVDEIEEKPKKSAKKKTASKAKSAKKTTKKSTAKKAPKKDSKKSTKKQAPAKKVKESKKQVVEMPALDIDLEQFNDELNKAIKKIDKK